MSKVQVEKACFFCKQGIGEFMEVEVSEQESMESQGKTRYAITDNTPCDACKERLQKLSTPGVLLIGVNTPLGADTMSPLLQEAPPVTGDFVLVPLDVVGYFGLMRNMTLAERVLLLSNSVPGCDHVAMLMVPEEVIDQFDHLNTSMQNLGAFYSSSFSPEALNTVEVLHKQLEEEEKEENRNPTTQGMKYMMPGSRLEN